MATLRGDRRGRKSAADPRGVGVELSKEIRGRKERASSWEAHQAQVHVTTGHARLGQRSVLLEKPRVTALEQHSLLYSIVPSRGEEESVGANASGSHDAALEVPITILPSTTSRLQRDVRAFRCTAEITAGLVRARAGSDAAEVHSHFYDEAANPVTLTRDSWWGVRGGVWDPISMAAVQMRTKAGDTLWWC